MLEELRLISREATAGGENVIPGTLFTFLQELREEVHRYRLPSGHLSIMRICRWLDSEA